MWKFDLNLNKLVLWKNFVIRALDLRTLYLRDLSFHGSTVLDPQVTIDLVKYIETGQIKPCLAATFKLHELRESQETFIAKKHTGNIVVTTWV